MTKSVAKALMLAAVALAVVGFVLLGVFCDQARWVAMPMMGVWVGLVALTGGAFQRRRLGTAVGGAALSLFAFIITFLLICNEGGRRPAIMLAAIGIPVYAIILAAAGAMLTEYGEDEPNELIEPELVQDWTLIERDDVE